MHAGTGPDPPAGSDAIIGGTGDARPLPNDTSVFVSLAMNGGLNVPGGDGVVSLWCSSSASAEADFSRLMITETSFF